MSSYVRYIDRIREYYLSQYHNAYRWAHFEDVPFLPLTKPLAESRVVLITTSQITTRDVAKKEGDGMQNVGGMYSLPADTPLDQLYSPADNYDRVATTLDDVDAFYPTSALHQAVTSGRIGSLTKRFHGVYNAYSQRRTQERDIPAVLERCREDGADAAVLTPV